MTRSKFTDSQFMDAVNQVEAVFAVPDICRELDIITATFYKWQDKFGGMGVSIISRMKEVDEEIRRLKKIYLEEKLKAEVVSKAIEKSGRSTATVKLKTILLQVFPCRPR